MICIDATHSTTGYDYNNEFSQWINFSCAIKERVGEIVPKWVMTDEADQFCSAWSSKLLCSWHIDHAWRGHLNSIRDRLLNHSLKVVQKILRDFLAQETCHLLLQLPMFRASRDFVILSLDSSREVDDNLHGQRKSCDHGLHGVLCLTISFCICWVVQDTQENYKGDGRRKEIVCPYILLPGSMQIPCTNQFTFKDATIA